MDNTNEKLNSKINELENRVNQISYSPKNIKFYYAGKISDLKSEIIDLRAQIIYYNNLNSEYELDIHGATKYFVEYYLDDLLYHKMQYFKSIKLITGKGTLTLFNFVRKYLISQNYSYEQFNYYYIIKLDW